MLGRTATWPGFVTHDLGGNARYGRIPTELPVYTAGTRHPP
ncbi:hypothetical protein AB0L14_16275 [Streptomyces sp. NPDC052727]